MRRKELGRNAARAPLWRDRYGQDFRLIGGDAGEDEARQALIPVADCPVRERPRRNEKLLKIGFLPGMSEARGVDCGAFRTSLDSNRSNTSGSFGGPSDHEQLTSQLVDIAMLSAPCHLGPPDKEAAGE